MSLFQKIKSAITVPQAAKVYGMEPDRRSMVCCPFHSDNTPSMKLNDTYYYCFGCGATGDVIDLTAKLFSLNPRQAAEKLVHDFGLDPDKPPANAIALPLPKRGLTDEQRADVAYCLRVLTDYLYLLHDWRGALQTHQPGRTAGRTVCGSPPHDRPDRTSDRPHRLWNTPAESRCRCTASVRVVPADAGRTHKPLCHSKVRLIIYSPKVVALIVRPTTLPF